MYPVKSVQRRAEGKEEAGTERETEMEVKMEVKIENREKVSREVEKSYILFGLGGSGGRSSSDRKVSCVDREDGETKVGLHCLTEGAANLEGELLRVVRDGDIKGLGEARLGEAVGPAEIDFALGVHVKERAGPHIGLIDLHVGCIVLPVVHKMQGARDANLRVFREALEGFGKFAVGAQ